MLRPRLRGAAQAQPCSSSCLRRATHATPRPPEGLPKRPRSTPGSSPRPKARDRPTSDPRRPVGDARDETTVERREPGQTDGRSGPGPQGTCRGDRGRGQGGADAGSPQAGAGREIAEELGILPHQLPQSLGLQDCATTPSFQKEI
uniref:opioid growth factor receptor-like n=1 Tax=Ictidomys tridecemlineatus TaxID=43179 RepID=UPI001A9F0701|nr:opioid growth factor receptor-like [Ictidomys tridecemlineatus]